MTTFSGNICTDSTATFGAYTWVQSDKVDDGSAIAEADVDVYVGAALGNTWNAQMRLINQAFNGTQAINALLIGGVASGHVSATADDLVLGTTSNDGSAHGLTIVSHSSQESRILAGTEAGGGRTGGLRFNHTAAEWRMENSAGVTSWRWSSSAFFPNTDGGPTFGLAGNRAAAVYAYDGDFADDVTVGGNFACNGQTPAAPPTYTPTNVTTDRSYDADTANVAEVADVLGTLIADLQAIGLLA